MGQYHIYLVPRYFLANTNNLRSEEMLLCAYYFITVSDIATDNMTTCWLVSYILDDTTALPFITS